MDQDTRQHGTLYNLTSSLPIIGPPSRFLMDYTKMGINQYGYLLGILRGGFVGVVMFSIMLFLSEAIPMGWSIIRYYGDMHYVQPVMAQIRAECIDIYAHRREYRYHLGDVDLYWLDPGEYLLKSTEPEARTK
jgi:hypothetical protein